MIICRINENHEWILVHNANRPKVADPAVPRSKIPHYDGYWNGEGWVPQSEKAAALVFAQYEFAKTYLQENHALMEQTSHQNAAQ